MLFIYLCVTHKQMNVLFLLFLIMYAHAQSNKDIDEAQTQRFVVNYTTDANIDWPFIARAFVDANHMIDTMVGQMVHIYGANNTNITSISPCPVPSYVNLMMNETAEMEILCCHAKHLRRGTPLLKFADFFDTSIYGNGAFVVSNRESSDFVAQIGYLQERELFCMQIKQCAQDKRIMVVENYSIRSQGLADMITDLLSYYSGMVAQLEHTIDCIGADIADTDCLYNATLHYQPPDPIQRNMDYDLQYSNICSSATLVAFEQFRSNPNC